MLQTFLQGARELFFPDNCLLCRQFLNSHHHDGLTQARPRLCPHCLSQLPWNTTAFYSHHHLAFDVVWSACVYEETAQKLLHAFKYGAKTSLQKTFVPLMVDFASCHHLPIASFDIMTPVPLHPTRQRERGYNQSCLLSQGINKYWKIAHQEKLLIRRKMTTTQTELGAKQRWTNLEEAFTINHSFDVTGKSVLLIDDLLTTGATLHWAANALKKAGAKYVGAFTFCVA